MNTCASSWSTTAAHSPYGGTLSLPARQLHDYLVANATVLDAFEAPHLGRFIVFRLRWEPAAAP